MNIKAPEWLDMPRRNGSWDKQDLNTRLLAMAYMLSHYTAALAREDLPIPWNEGEKCQSE